MILNKALKFKKVVHFYLAFAIPSVQETVSWEYSLLTTIKFRPTKTAPKTPLTNAEKAFFKEKRFVKDLNIEVSSFSCTEKKTKVCLSRYWKHSFPRKLPEVEVCK